MRKDVKDEDSFPQWYFSEEPSSNNVLRHGASGGGKSVMHWRKLLSARVDVNKALWQKSRGDQRKPVPAVAARRLLQQPTNGCAENSSDYEWLDNDGDGCRLYEENPSWCMEADLYGNEDGFDADDKCCVCGLLQQPTNGCAENSSDYEWLDNGGDGCRLYEENPWWCMEADLYGNEDGFDADDKCCVCVPDQGQDDDVDDNDSVTCTFTNLTCANITSGGWGTNAATVCDPDKGSFYVCDNAADSGIHASVACSDTCASAFGCKWVENNINIAGEMWVGDVSYEAECIQLVRNECPSATIAHMDVDGSGSCWCQYGTDLTSVSGAGWKNCLLSSIYGMMLSCACIRACIRICLYLFPCLCLGLGFCFYLCLCLCLCLYRCICLCRCVSPCVCVYVCVTSLLPSLSYTGLALATDTITLTPISAKYASMPSFLNHLCMHTVAESHGNHDDSDTVSTFGQYDSNQDNCINQTEFEANPAMEANAPTWAMVIGIWNVSCVSEEQFDMIGMAMQILANLDFNSDGRLTYGEFVAANIESDTPMDTLFRSYDAIRGTTDGFITIDDLLKIITVQPDDNTSNNGGERQMSDLAHFHRQLFTPKTAMCILYAGYNSDNGDEDQYDTNANCTAQAGYIWMSPRRFEEGRWSTKQSCTAGVCSSAPWDWELAKKPGQCAQLGGACSRYCKTCDTWSDDTEYCIIDGIKTQKECDEAFLNWNVEHQMCYGTSGHATCFTRNDMRRMSCHDLGNKGCDQSDWTMNPLFNGDVWRDTFNAFGLDCYTNNYGTCNDQATCISGGSCNDWSYESWDMGGFDGQSSDSTSVCRIPFTTGAEWGGPDLDSCHESDGWVQYDDACIVNNMETSSCTLAGPSTHIYLQLP